MVLWIVTTRQAVPSDHSCWRRKFRARGSEFAVQGAQRCSRLRGDGKVKRIARTQSKFMPLDEAAGDAKMLARDWNQSKGLGGDLPEQGHGGNAIGRFDLAGPDLQGKREGKLGRDPLADKKVFRRLPCKPILDSPCIRLVGVRSKKQRCVEIKAQ